MVSKLHPEQCMRVASHCCCDICHARQVGSWCTQTQTADFTFVTYHHESNDTTAAVDVFLFLQRNLGVDYQGLRDMMQAAAEEQQLLDPDNKAHEDWVPLEVLRLFTESLTDGMSGIMESFFTDDAEQVLAGVEAGSIAVQQAAAEAEAAMAAEAATAAATGPPGRQKGASSSKKGGVRGVAGQKSTLGRAPVPPLGPPPAAAAGASRRGGGLGGLPVTPLRLNTLMKHPLQL
jgi:hypothetical protein